MWYQLSQNKLTVKRQVIDRTSSSLELVSSFSTDWGTEYDKRMYNAGKVLIVVKSKCYLRKLYVNFQPYITCVKLGKADFGNPCSRKYAIKIVKVIKALKSPLSTESKISNDLHLTFVRGPAGNTNFEYPADRNMASGWSGRTALNWYYWWNAYMHNVAEVQMAPWVVLKKQSFKRRTANLFSRCTRRQCSRYLHKDWHMKNLLGSATICCSTSKSSTRY